MTFVVTTRSDLECPHTGVASLSPPSPKLTVSGAGVVVKQDLLTAPLTGCTQVPPPATNVACTKVASVISGEAAKLTVRHQAVLLDSLAATTIGVPQNQLSCRDARQTKLSAK
jgi:hypothetical protein